MNSPLNRRQFIVTGSLLAAGWKALPSLRAQGRKVSPNDKIVLGIMGVNGRGSALARGFSALPGVEVAYICDVDERAIAKGLRAVSRKQSRRPKGIGDFRRILDDKDVDALVIATPDHWHGPATVLACAAGKHVYVEKPAAHNPHEGELMIAAARKYHRHVQLGTQRRSMPGIIEAVQRIRNGIIGRVLFARGWYNNSRPSIGTGHLEPAPSWLNYSLWEGPAPEEPFRSNLTPYLWHWYWHWGTGEIGNNGVHALDVCRWGMDVDYPRRVSSGGGKYRYQDDQQTPDTHVVTFDFDGKSITWEGRSWHRRGFEGSMFGMEFYGVGGTVVIDGGGYIVYDPHNKLIQKRRGSGSARPHFENFLNAIRGETSLNAEIETGYKSTLLCLLGNIAYRTHHTLEIDEATGHILDDPEAQKLWRRKYRPGWEPKV